MVFTLDGVSDEIYYKTVVYIYTELIYTLVRGLQTVSVFFSFSSYGDGSTQTEDSVICAHLQRTSHRKPLDKGIMCFFFVYVSVGFFDWGTGVFAVVQQYSRVWSAMRPNETEDVRV